VARRTLAGTAEVRGVGLHTGRAATARCTGAPSGQGIVFRRTDLPGAPTIPARLAEVQSTERRTALGDGEAAVQTVEHLLAAAAALELDDLTVELDGPEPPIGDGSFVPFLAALTEAGIESMPGQPTIYRVVAPFQLADGDSTYVVAPARTLRLTTTIEWAHPLIGRQSGAYEITADEFRRELAPARTFGFLHEAEALRARGLALGAATLALALATIGVAGLQYLTDRAVERSQADYRARDLDGAAGAAQDAIDLQPWAAEQVRLDMQRAQQAGDYAKAREAIDEAIERSPDDYRLHLLAARMANEDDDPAAAREAILAAHALNPRDPEIFDEVAAS